MKFIATPARALALLVAASGFVLVSCSPAPGTGGGSLELNSACTPGQAGEIQLLHADNTGTLRVVANADGDVTISCTVGEPTTTTPEETTTTEAPTTTTSEETTTTTEAPTTTTSEETTTTTTEAPTTSTSEETTTTIGV
jgi:hypothetical protein